MNENLMKFCYLTDCERGWDINRTRVQLLKKITSIEEISHGSALVPTTILDSFFKKHLKNGIEELTSLYIKTYADLDFSVSLAQNSIFVFLEYDDIDKLKSELPDYRYISTQKSRELPFHDSSVSIFTLIEAKCSSKEFENYNQGLLCKTTDNDILYICSSAQGDLTIITFKE